MLRLAFWPIILVFAGIGLLRILRGIFWALVWAVAGVIVGLTFGSALDQPLVWSATMGAALAAGLGFIYGLLIPNNKQNEQSKQASKARFGLETCAWCKGTGLEDKRGGVCVTCEGPGRVLVEQPARPCRRCRGKGRLLLGRSCPMCNGAGWSTYLLADKTIVNPAPKRKISRVKPV
jgi:hypothetical protein